MVTGGTSGIGRSVALRLGGNGHSIDVVGGINLEKGRLLKNRFASLPGSMRFFPVNLSSIDETKEFAESYLAENGALDVLFLNAGTYVKQPHLDKHGLDTGFAVNFLHRFILLLLLNPLLRRGHGRAIINGSSRFAQSLRLNEEVFARKYSTTTGMMQATYANGYLTHWLNRRFQSEVPVQSVNPGFVKTNSLPQNALATILSSLFAIPPEQAAEKIVAIIENENLSRTDGVYLNGRDVKGFSKGIRKNPEAFLKLWQLSLQACALRAPDWLET